MRNIVLLLIAVLGLYSFSGSKEERDAYIKKAIIERAREAKMEIKDIKIVKVRDISERTYAEYVVEGGTDGISGNLPLHLNWASNAEIKAGEKIFEEKLATLSNEKGYGYFVRIKCYLDKDRFGAGERTMQFVVSKQAGTDLAMRGGWGSR